MKQTKKIRGLAFVLALSMVALAGCGAKTSKPFANSDGITDKGLWKGIKATKYVDLCDYSAISIPVETRTITDTDVQEKINEALKDYTTTKQVKDRAVVDGDSVNMDYVGTVDGVAFDGGSTNGAGTDVTIGKTNYVGNFLQQLIGHKPGESFDVKVTFPADYGVENLNGKDAVFAVTINYITETVTPELTDAFIAEKLSATKGWKTVAEMKASILSDLQNAAITAYIKDYVVEKSTIKSLPKAILDYQQNSMILFYQTYANQYEMDLDTFLSTYAGYASKEELLKKNLDDNTKSANYSLVMQAIAEKTGITVTADDVAAFFKKNYNTDDYSKYETTYGMPFLMQAALYQKVLDSLKSTAVMA